MQVQSLHASLTLLNRVLKGAAVEDAKTKEVIEALLLQQTPGAWQDVWTGPREPAEFLSAVAYRAKCTQVSFFENSWSHHDSFSANFSRKND